MVNVNQETISQANEALQEKAPQINDAPSTNVDLMRGVYRDDSWQTTAVVRELTGEDEESISSFVSKKDLVYSEYMTELLKLALVSIGTISLKDDPSIVEDLIIGDRDLLFIGTMKATYGRFRDLEVGCSSCSTTNYVTLNLETDFKFEKPSIDMFKPLEVTLKDGSSVLINYPKGSDSTYVAKKCNTVAEQNTAILARCSVWPNDASKNTEKWAKSLGISDRSKLVKALTTDPPGPKMEEVDTQCAKCSKELVILMDWVSLLLG